LISLIFGTFSFSSLALHAAGQLSRGFQVINFRVRKLLARIVLPIFSIWFCILPIRSCAFVSPLLPIAAAAVDSAGVVTAVDSAATAVVTLIGAVVSYFAFQEATSGYVVRIPVTSDPSKVPPAPSAPASVTPQVKPASSSDYQAICDSLPEGLVYPPSTTYTYWAGGTYTVVMGAPHCIRYYRLNPNCSGGICPYGQNAAFFQKITTLPATTTCPSGYSVSGSTCVLSDARLAVSDKAVDYQRSGTTLSPMQDVDTSSSPIHGSLLPNGSYEVAGANSQGQPLRIVVTPLQSGGSEVSISFQSADLAGNTVMTNRNLVIDSAGRVQSASQAQTSAALNVDPVTQTAAVQATNNAVQNPTASTVQFPSDYARTGEAATAASVIGSKLDILHNDLSATTSVADPVDLTSNDMPNFGNTFSSLLGWHFPSHVSSCPKPSLDLSSMGLGVYSMDSHCTIINNHFGALNAAMVVVWTILALFIVLRA